MITSILLVVIVLLIIGYYLERRFLFSKWFISPPLLGGFIGLLIGLPLLSQVGITFGETPTILTDVFAVAFLFSIGFKIGLVYKKKHLLRLLYLFLLSTGIAVILDMLVLSIFHESLFYIILGSGSLSWE